MLLHKHACLVSQASGFLLVVCWFCPEHFSPPLQRQTQPVRSFTGIWLLLSDVATMQKCCCNVSEHLSRFRVWYLLQKIKSPENWRPERLLLLWSVLCLPFRPEGYLYDKEALLEYYIHQKNDFKRKLKEYEKQKKKLEVCLKTASIGSRSFPRFSFSTELLFFFF